MMAPTTVPDLLEAAADLLDAEGWTRHIIYDPLTGHRCAWGALLAASTDKRSDRPLWTGKSTLAGVARQATTEYMRAVTGPWTDTDNDILTLFNDYEAKRRRQITALLRGTARWVRQQEDG